MDLEQNPFQENIPVGTIPITSIAIESNIDWLVIPPVAIGANALIDLSSADDVLALKVFGTGTGIGVPSMISLLPAHIPNIEIGQVNGLQAELNSNVSSIEGSVETAIEVTNNGSGDYLVVPHFGSSINTLAQGNDPRLSAPVTGIRLGAGDASNDTAAVARVDYWDTTVFNGVGDGLVPDPGGIGSTRYLREDGTWVTPSGSGTVTSVDMTVPPGLFTVTGRPITTTGTLAVALTTQVKNRVWIGPVSGVDAAPTFRDINWLDVSALAGNTATSFSAGNDTRFPASVTGIRKSAGAGSTDVAATAGVDYAAATAFGSKGPSHSKGLVPDPGTGSSPYLRFLREDSSWQVFTPADASLTNPMLAAMDARTIKANATAGSASPTNVDPKTARSASLLNIESQTTFGNADYSALATDRHVVTNATFTLPRTVTLPLANSFNAGQYILIADDFGAINGSNYLKIAVQGGDNIQGSASDFVIDVKYGSVKFDSDGSNQWNITECSPPVRRVYYSGNTTYTTPTGIKSIFVECIAGGGGGGGAVASGSNASAAGGGGGGGYSNKLISSPAASYSITIGNGGSGGASDASGDTGDDTDFGGIVTATGGFGGAAMAGGTTPEFSLGGYGGYATTGDWGAQGSVGGMGTRLSGTVAASGFGGAAGAYGGGIQGLTSENEGNLGCIYGGGGSGALSTTVGERVGGDGQQGIVIITEYY